MTGFVKRNFHFVAKKTQKKNSATAKILKMKSRDFKIDMKQLRITEKGICKDEIRDLKTFIRRRNDKIGRLPANSDEIGVLVEVIQEKEEDITRLYKKMEEIEYGVHDDFLAEKFQSSIQKASENIREEKEQYQKRKHYQIL